MFALWGLVVFKGLVKPVGFFIFRDTISPSGRSKCNYGANRDSLAMINNMYDSIFQTNFTDNRFKINAYDMTL